MGKLGQVWASLGKSGQVKKVRTRKNFLKNGKKEAERIRKGNRNLSG